MEQFDQSLHYLPFRLHILDAWLCQSNLVQILGELQNFSEVKILEFLRKVIQYLYPLNYGDPVSLK